MTIKAYCDGGFKGKINPYGYGSYRCDALNLRVHKIKLDEKVKTSVDAEAETLLIALQNILESISINDSIKTIHLFCDCNGLINVIKRRIRHKTEKIDETHRQFKYISIEIANLIRNAAIEVNLHWIRRKHIVKQLGH